MKNYIFTLMERNSDGALVETERIEGTLKEIVAALEKGVEIESSWDNPNQHYNNPTGYEALKNVATGETYGRGTCFPGEWMSDSDIREVCVEVIDPETEADLGFDPAADDYQEKCERYTFMVLPRPLEYELNRVRKWLDYLYGTTGGVGRGVMWALTEQ